MKRLRLKTVVGFFLAAVLSSPAWGSVPPQPGTINYIEGQAAIGAQALNERSVGSTRLAAGQSLSTENGRAEILLTPGVFLRLGDHSSVQMISPGLADTIMTLSRGRAIVEVTFIRPQNNIRIGENNSSAQLLKPGLYDFDSSRGLIRVFDGEAMVQSAGRQIELKSEHVLALNAAGKLKAQRFDRKAYTTDDFYRWASLRSAYLAEANVSEARNYTSVNGAYPAGWYGGGWYWNPWYSAYTFIPGDGIFFDSFGWGFYSPWFAFGAPYFGFGYGYLGGGYYHHFGPSYTPGVAAAHSAALAAHAYRVSGSGLRAGVSHGGGFAGGAGFRGGFAGGGGFHGGGGGRGR